MIGGRRWRDSVCPRPEGPAGTGGAFAPPEGLPKEHQVVKRRPRKDLRVKTRIKLLSLVGTVLAAGAIASAPLAASAADGDSDVAVFVGHTTGLTPVQLTGGSGSYGFVSDVCAGASTDTTPPEVATCGISSSGTYTNIVCGTGSAAGSATATEPDSTDTFSYSILFVSGVGVLTGGATGVVLIVPTGNGLPSSCVTQFTPVGVAVTG